MSITRNRELSQFGSFIYIDNVSQDIGITTEAFPYVGIGTDDPQVKLQVNGDTNIHGDLTVINGTIESSSYTLNGAPLVDASVEYWSPATGGNDIYRLLGNIGIGTSILSQKLTVNGNVSANQFISTATSPTPPFVVSSNQEVSNLNASFLRGKTPPSGTIVGTTDTQSLTNKTLVSPSLQSPTVTSNGIFINGSTSGSTRIISSAIGGGSLTLPSTDDTFALVNFAQTLTNKTIAASSNTISGLTNANLSGSAGITNANLANSTISGISLGSNLNNLTFGSYLTSSGIYNGSTARTVSVAGTSINTPNTLVARNNTGDFSAGDINCTDINCGNIVASFNATADSFIVSGGTNNQFLKGDGSLDSTIYVSAGRAVAISMVFG